MTYNKPIFLPDATRGFVKSLTSAEVKKTGTKAMVVNTYHLFLEPGEKLIKKAGGIHKFINWDGFLISDSGGYQVFSLIRQKTQKETLTDANPLNPPYQGDQPNAPLEGGKGGVKTPMGEVNDDGVIFRSPLNGAKHKFTPEKIINIQFDLGVDAMICLDDCPPNDAGKETLTKAVERTIAWAKRSKKEYEKQLKKRKPDKKNRPLIFAVIQGGEDLEMRKYCAAELVKIGFDGYGFGARHLDSKGSFLAEVLETTAKAIPDGAYKFALGIGRPEDIVKCSKMGWQFFDCVIPTREGRHGKLFIYKKNFLEKPKLESKDNFYESININNTKFLNDKSPINQNSKIPELREYSKSFLRHLFKMRDPLAGKLASLNNLEFYNDLMKKL